MTLLIKSPNFLSLKLFFQNACIFQKNVVNLHLNFYTIYSNI